MLAALRRARDADRFVDVGHGEGRDQIGAGLAEYADLPGVIVLRLLGAS